MMRITIPTMGRVNAQLTWKAMPPRVIDRFHVTVVCEATEVKALQAQGINAVACRARGKGIGVKRQWILDTFDDNIICMFDDDLNTWASCNTTTSGTKYLKASPEAIYDGLLVFQDLLGKYASGSLGGRSFAMNRPLIQVNPARLVRALGYNRKLMPATAKFRLPTCEDLDMQLQLLVAGREVFTYNGLVQEQKGSNAPGGCSAYRDLDFQREQYRRLVNFHPRFVTPTMRTYRRGWEGMDKTQPSVNINWRAAAAFGKEKNS